MPTTTLVRESVRKAELGGRYAAWRPHFRAEEFQPGLWWILDGDTRVGLVSAAAHFLELVNFFPGAPRPVAYPEIYHAPTSPGDRITLAKWLDWAQSTTSSENGFQFTAGGRTLTVRFQEKWANGATGWTACEFAVDPDYGYVVRCEVFFDSPELCPVEFCNFLPENVVDDRPGHSRYPFILWQHPGGQILRWNQNNPGAFCWGNRDHHNRRRVATAGFIGYFGETDRCPVIELEQTTAPVSAATCHCMLDEHLHWLLSKEFRPLPNAAGRYVQRATFILASLPGPAGAALAALAKPNDLLTDRACPEFAERYKPMILPCDRPGQPRTMAFPVLRQNCLCDFSERLDPYRSDRCEIFFYPDADSAAPVSIAPVGGRQSPPCLKVRVDGTPVRAEPGDGTAFHVTPGKPMRFGGWLKSDLRDGEAYFRVWEWLYSPANVTREYRTDSLFGQRDWTSFTVEFTPVAPKAHCVSVQLVVSGHGTVWSDEWWLG